MLPAFKEKNILFEILLKGLSKPKNCFTEISVKYYLARVNATFNRRGSFKNPIP